MWLRSHGLRFGGELDGVVLRWARLVGGEWIAEVRVTVEAGRGHVDLTLWCAAEAVRPAGPRRGRGF